MTTFILEFSGLQPSPIYEGNGTTNAGTGTTISTGALSNTQADAVKVAGGAIDTGTNNAWSSTGSGWTLPTNGSEPDGTAWLVAACAYKILSVAQSDTETWSRTGSSVGWDAQIGTYLVAADLPPGLGPGVAMDEVALNMQSQIAMMR